MRLYVGSFEIPAARVPSATPARFYYSGLQYPTRMLVHCCECECDEMADVVAVVPVILGLN